MCIIKACFGLLICGLEGSLSVRMSVPVPSRAWHMVFDMCLLGGCVLHWSLVVNWMLELQESYEIRIYSVILLIMCARVHLCVRMCAWAQVSLEARRGVNYLELDLDAGNRNDILCKSSLTSQPLSRLSSPVAHSFYSLQSPTSRSLF